MPIGGERDARGIALRSQMAFDPELMDRSMEAQNCRSCGLRDTAELNCYESLSLNWLEGKLYFERILNCGLSHKDI